MRSHQSNVERGLFHLLNGETAHGLTIVQHDDEPPKATPTYMLNLNIGWADSIIAERMYLHDARGIAYILADALDCPVGDVEAE
jgi:hypothetical protein